MPCSSLPELESLILALRETAKFEAFYCLEESQISQGYRKSSHFTQSENNSVQLLALEINHDDDHEVKNWVC